MSRAFTPGILQEFTSSDIDWIQRHGHPEIIPAGTHLIQPQQPIEALYLILDGNVSVIRSDLGIEFMRLIIGDMIGAVPGLVGGLSHTTVIAQSDTKVLVIPFLILAEKLHIDLDFAAHLYRSIALRLVQQITSLLRHLGQSTQIYPAQRTSITLFSELNDVDLDWLIAAGLVQHFATGVMLVEPDRPLDGLSIVLDGVLSLRRPEQEIHPIDALFSEETSASPDQEFARLSRGDLLGELWFANSHLMGISAQATREIQILFIPRWRFAAKLLHDVGFASRFYRALVVLLVNQQQQFLYQYHDRTHENLPTESDSQLLTQVALAEARFEWMLKRIQTKVITEKAIQW
jgi:CRP-like cAMP-binding protein